MNFKMKFAVIAALSAMLAAPAFAVTDYDVVGNLVGADVNALAQAELLAVGTIAGDGNVAFTNQETSANMSYIDQLGATNFASVVQATNDGALAVVYQIGDANRAVINQN